MLHTRVLKVRGDSDSESGEALGRWADGTPDLERWEVPPAPASASDANDSNSEAMAALREAGASLRTSDVPVAFPTETVYGLGADATRSAAVRGIYAAKGRPLDNPLIVHVCDLAMLRGLLSPVSSSPEEKEEKETPGIPEIYAEPIRRFWPGPLTILLPNPHPSRLAPEVTAGLPTFGCRMPASALARSLIRLAGSPLAAPSANASTRPSPTAARHVIDDLAGRVELVLDGGPCACAVGVESTVVDGLCDPPVVLRPGGVSIAQLRECGGRWAGVQKAYRDAREDGGGAVNGGGGGNGGNGSTAAPRAPGMKYKHYSPRAKVVLYEASAEPGVGVVTDADVGSVLAGRADGEIGKRMTVGVIRTQRWPVAGGLKCSELTPTRPIVDEDKDTEAEARLAYEIREGDLLGADDGGSPVATLLDINLGPDVGSVAQGLFSALRELDRRGADVIFVEGVSDGDDIAAAVMNRLRKAASEIRA